MVSPGVAPEGGSGLPEVPSDGDLKGGIATTKGAIDECASHFGISGLVSVRITIRGDGTVDDAEVLGELAKTNGRKCLVKALLRARFPPFQLHRYVFTYPLSL